jgi:acetoin:2,6-dichlorophenolindophenol oxidoreductase subunit alpha
MYSNDEMVKMYQQMVLGRKYVEKIESLLMQGKLQGFFHLSFGQEAIGVGILNAMRSNDFLVPTHRQQALLVNLLDMNKFTAELYGKTSGYCKGMGFEFHLSSIEHNLLPVSAVLGTGAPLGVGAAMALKLDQSDSVVVCCMGDGSTSEGNVHEAMNIASCFNLPIVFVIENNGWAVSQPVCKQCKVPDLSIRASSYGMKGVTIDGNDVIQVRKTMEEAIKDAKQYGPNVVELKVVRLRGHFEGDPQVYRDLNEVVVAKENDCIANYEEMIVQKKILTNSEIETIKLNMQKIVTEAFIYAEQDSPLTAEDVLDLNKVYSTMIGGIQ